MTSITFSNGLSDIFIYPECDNGTNTICTEYIYLLHDLAYCW